MAAIGFYALGWLGLIDTGKSLYTGSRVIWLSALVGGALFGFGQEGGGFGAVSLGELDGLLADFGDARPRLGDVSLQRGDAALQADGGAFEFIQAVDRHQPAFP